MESLDFDKMNNIFVLSHMFFFFNPLKKHLLSAYDMSVPLPDPK